MAALEAAYPVGPWLQWRRTPKGSSNTSFFVTTASGEYVLRRSNVRKTLESLEFETRLLEHLVAHGYPAPPLVRPIDGGHARHDGRYFLLTELVAGSHYDARNPAHLPQAGAALARYHRLVADLSPPLYRAPVPLLAGLGSRGHEATEHFQRLASTMLDDEATTRLHRSLAMVTAHASRVRSDLRAVLYDLPTVVIQGSFGRSALLYEGDELVGVVDYDRAGVDLRALDLAYTVKALCRADENRWVGLDDAKLEAFLRAYEEVEPLAPVELEALPLVFQAQRLLKVLKKCENVVAKHAVVGQQAKDVEKVAQIVERECERLSWLESSAPRLGALLNG